jgi:hypothetical protein
MVQFRKFLGIALSALSIGVLALNSAFAAEAENVLEKMPLELETRFALSALPPHLRDQAGVYILEPKKGYSLHRKGSNGFACAVERTEWIKADYRNDIYTALCYDAEGTKNHLQVWLDAGNLRAKGLTAEALKKEIEKRFRNKTYRAPAKSGLSYMIAPLMRTYPSPDPADKTVATMSMPHFMFYAPNLTDKDIGGFPPPSPYPFIFEQGPHGYIIHLVGEAERAKLVADQKDLVDALCEYRSALCLGQKQGDAHGH